MMEWLTAMAIDKLTDWKGALMLPAVAALNFSDGFTRCSQVRVLEQTMQSFLTLYQYQHMTLYELSELVMLWQGAVIGKILNAYGVWQGAPLGMHNFCLSTVNFCMSLIEFNCLHRIFANPVIFLASYVMIAGDLTSATRLQNMVDTLSFIMKEAPKHNLHIGLSKCEVYVTGPQTPESENIVTKIGELSFKVTRDGLGRLLGAPISSKKFCTAEGGHIKKAAAQAGDRVNTILTLSHSRVRTLLLSYCAVSALNHLLRLVEPSKMDEEAKIFQKKLINRMRLTISAEKLSDYQQRQLVLPT